MGSWFQRIVDRDATEEEARVLAKSIRDWLLEEGIIDGTMTDCVLGEDFGYPPGPNCEETLVEADDNLRSLRTNGLSIITEKTVFDCGGAELSLICDSCGHRFGIPDNWSDAIDEWWEATGPGVLSCPGCGAERPITEWQHDPPFGFGYLGLEFWNWPPFKNSFVEEVARRLGHRVLLVAGKL